MFANPNAVVIGESIYTPAWLIDYGPAELKAAGITAEILESKTSISKESVPGEGMADALKNKTAERKALN